MIIEFKKILTTSKNTLLLAIVYLMSFSLHAQDENYEEWYLLTKDTQRIFVKELGSGKDTLILIHGGFGANHDYLIDISKGLEKKYHFVFYDQRGSLLSPVSDSLIIFQKNVDDLLSLTKALKIKRAKLICHSMGTLVGMEFQKQHPELVEKLVLIGSIPIKADSAETIFSEQMVKNIQWLESQKKYTDLITKYENRKNDLTDKERTELWRIKFAVANIYNIDNWKLMKGGWAYYNQKTGSLMSQSFNFNYDYSLSLTKNKFSTTLIQGQYDFLDFNAKNHKNAIGNLSIQLVTIPNAGHNIWVDQPEMFRNELIKALSSKNASH
jgi:pimeloyl-ACP methyl ester carboxylesterase